MVRRMAAANPGWGAPRVHRELLKLGFRISEQTVSRFMPKRTYQGDDLLQRRQTWKAFLLNHREAISAMDFLVVSSWRFEPLYILVILDHGRRIVRHFNVTASPTEEWAKQQIREATPSGAVPRYFIHDRDSIFGSMKGFLESMGIRQKVIADHSAWQNGAIERMNATLRSELLDHVIPLGEAHLRQLIKDFLYYYDYDRTHLGLGKDCPLGRPIERKPDEASSLDALPRCGGLHHRYTWRKVA